MHRLIIEQHGEGTDTSYWLSTLYGKTYWYSQRIATAQFKHHSKKLAMDKAFELLDYCGELQIKIMK